MKEVNMFTNNQRSQKVNNLVKKHMERFNKPATHVDKKKQSKYNRKQKYRNKEIL